MWSQFVSQIPRTREKSDQAVFSLLNLFFFFFYLDFKVFVFDIEPEAVVDAHVLIGDPRLRDRLRRSTSSPFIPRVW